MHTSKFNLHTAFPIAATIAAGRPRLRNRAPIMLARLSSRMLCSQGVHSETQGNFLDEACSLAGMTRAGAIALWQAIMTKDSHAHTIVTSLSSDLVPRP